MTVMSYLGAIGAAQKEAMLADERVVIIGEDVEANVYGTTGGAGKSRAVEGDFTQQFGRNRIRNTPISEEVIVGAAIGAAMTGLRPIVDLSYSSFLYMAMDQFVNQAAKNRYMFGGQASIPVVFRSAMFYGLNTGAHHSDRPYPMFMNVPGLKVITPAYPSDAKGLLRSAVDSDDPVLIFEACILWGSKEDVDENEYKIPLGVGRTLRSGNDVTVIAVSGAVPEAVAAADQLEKEGISVEVFDPRTMVPLDVDGILTAAAKTGRVVVADPAHQTCGVAAEISALVVRTHLRQSARPDPPGDHPGHADPVQPRAGKAVVPQPDSDRRRGPGAARRRRAGRCLTRPSLHPNSEKEEPTP